MIPTPGRIVLYQLTKEDCDDIMYRRSQVQLVASRKVDQGKEKIVVENVHGRFGNIPHEGDIVPAIVVRVWNPDGTPSFNGQAFLDGNDTHWITSRLEGDNPGEWRWPEIKSNKS